MGDSDTRLRGLIDVLAARLDAVEARVGALDGGHGPRPARAPIERAPIERAPLEPHAVEPTPFGARAAAWATGRRLDAPPTRPTSRPKEAPWMEKIAIDPGATRATDGVGLERLVGGRAFAIAGSIVVMIGVALFLKLAYDQGWLRLLSPAAKCAWAAGFGAALLVAGELTRRRIGALASAGLSSAGVGAIYAAAYATYGVYKLVSPPAAFALLAGAAAIGFIVGVRARVVVVTLIATVGAYLAPLLLADAPAAPLVLPAYLVAVLCVSLGVAGWLGRWFTVIRAVAWLGTMGLGMWWALRYATTMPLPTLGFVALAWAVAHADLRVAAGRAPIVHAPDAAPTPLPQPVRDAWFLLGSAPFGAWALGLALFTLDRSGMAPLWIAPAALGVATLLLALATAPFLGVVRETPRLATDRLAVVLLTQSGALLCAALALALDPLFEACAGLGVAAASVLAGAILRSRGLRVYGVIVLALSSLRAVFEHLFGAAPMAHVGGLAFTHWSVVVAGAGALWIGAGRAVLLGADGRRTPDGAVCAGVGLAMLMLAFAHSGASEAWKCGAWLVIGAGALGMGARAHPGLRLPALSVPVLTLATAYALAHHASQGAPAHPLGGLIFTVWSGVLAACAALWFACAGRASRLDVPRAPMLAGASAGGALFLLAAAIAHPKAQASWLCVAWLFLSALTAAAHPFQPRMALRLWATPLLILTTAAWLVAFDPSTWSESTEPALLHTGLIIALAISIVGAVVGRAQRRLGTDAGIGIGSCSLAGAALLAFAASSLEIARTAAIVTSDQTSRDAAVSVWWGLLGVALVAIGFARRIPPVRHTGLALIIAGTLKALVFDLTAVSPSARVVSFIGLGLLMLLVALGYARLSERVKGAEAPPQPDALP